MRAAVFQGEHAFVCRLDDHSVTLDPAFFVASFFLCRSRGRVELPYARLVAVVTDIGSCVRPVPQRFCLRAAVVDGALGVRFQLLTAVDLPYTARRRCISAFW